MSARPTTLQRAFELARSGVCRGLADIRERLKAERFMDVDQQLYGRSLQQQLKRLCDEARGRR
jgi:hypothetical protein